MSPKLLANLGITITTITLGLGVNSLAQAQTPATSIPEISWESHLSSFGLDEQSNIGKTFVFRCPPAPADTYYGYGVTGTDNYEAKSKICKTAVHAGMITREGGTVTLQLNSGQPLYTGSERNGVKSRDARSSDLSFALIGTPITVQNPSTPPQALATIPEIQWNSTLKDFGLNGQENIGKQMTFKCTAAPADTYYGYGVTGTDNYEANSKICKTAVHAGMITREGGTVTLQLDGGQSVYTASERNGVKSRNGKASDRSFFFVGTPVFNNNNSNPNSASGDSNPIQRGVEKGVESGIEDGVRDALRGLF